MYEDLCENAKKLGKDPQAIVKTSTYDTVKYMYTRTKITAKNGI